MLARLSQWNAASSGNVIPSSSFNEMKEVHVSHGFRRHSFQAFSRLANYALSADGAFAQKTRGLVDKHSFN